jgi:hypothetical protein
MRGQKRVEDARERALAPRPRKKTLHSRGMDCRVKPGNDSGSVSANARWYYGDPCIIWNGYAGINICY